MAENIKKTSYKPRQGISSNLLDSTKSSSQQIEEIRGMVEENLRYTKTLRNRPTAGGTELAAQKELQNLLQENLRVSKELHEMTKKIQHWVVMQRIFGVVKILIIIIPIVLGILYLPPLLQNVIKPYQELLNLGQNDADGNIIDNQDIFQQLKNQILNEKPD